MFLFVQLANQLCARAARIGFLMIFDATCLYHIAATSSSKLVFDQLTQAGFDNFCA